MNLNTCFYSQLFKDLRTKPNRFHSTIILASGLLVIAKNGVTLPSKEREGEEMQERENIWEHIQSFDLHWISFKRTITTILHKLHICDSRFKYVNS